MSHGLFHATPYDLSGQTELLPPSVTGREPHWEGMAQEELGLVFLVDTIEAARGWGSDLAGQYGQSFYVYEVTATELRPGAHGIYAAPRAHIERLILIYDAAADEVFFKDGDATVGTRGRTDA